MLPAKIKSALQYYWNSPSFIPLCISGIMGFLIVVSLFNALSFFYADAREANAASRLLESASTPGLANSMQEETLADKTKKIHMFGHALSSSRNIPLTALNIQLTGIFYEQNAKMSQISIVYDNQPDKIYREGDVLPNGAVIEQIFQNEVIIQYNDDLQKLVLFNK